MALGIIALIILIGWLTAPTQEDIQECVKASNYTYERCEFEITR